MSKTHYSEEIKKREIQILSDGYQNNRGIASITEDELIYEVIDNPMLGTTYEESDSDYYKSKEKYQMRLRQKDKKRIGNTYSDSIAIGYSSNLKKAENYLFDKFILTNKELRAKAEELSDTLSIKNNDPKYKEILEIFEKYKLNLIHEFMSGNHNRNKLEDLESLELIMFDYNKLSIRYTLKSGGYSSLASTLRNDKNNDEYKEFKSLIGNKNIDKIKLLVNEMEEKEEMRRKTGYYKANPFNKFIEASVEDSNGKIVKFTSEIDLNNFFKEEHSKLSEFQKIRNFNAEITLENKETEIFQIAPSIKLTINNEGFNAQDNNLFTYLNKDKNYNMSNKIKTNMKDGYSYVDLSKIENNFKDINQKKSKKSVSKIKEQ